MLINFQKVIFKFNLIPELMNIIHKILVSAFICLTLLSDSFSQEKSKARIAVIQAEALPTEDPFMEDFDMSKVKPLMMSHFEKLLGLFEKAGEMGADLVCGPEDMQHIGSYGLYIDVKDPETNKILFNSLAVPVPGKLTDMIAAIAKRYNMYIIAPIYEEDAGKIYNTAVVFDRNGNIIGKHRKTVLPIMETWLVSTGDRLRSCTTWISEMSRLLHAGKCRILKYLRSMHWRAPISFSIRPWHATMKAARVSQLPIL